MKILQLVPEARPADAVTNQALRIDRALRRLGHRPAMAADAFSWSLDQVVHPAPLALQQRWDLILDHFSIGADYHELLENRAEPLWMVYHNITPAHFLLPWSPSIASRCQEGRALLAATVHRYQRALADSRFNAQELQRLGHLKTDVLPIAVERGRNLEAEPLASLRHQLRRRHPLLLFVGRIAPQKNHPGLFRVLELLRRGAFPGAELVLVGSERGFEPYGHFLMKEAERQGLKDAVHLVGQVTNRELWSYYALADVFCCLSNHEGFCVPVVEAFLSGLPVVTTDRGAVAETAGDAALVVPDGDEACAAEACAQILARPELARHLADAGRRRAQSFSAAALHRRVERLFQDRGVRRPNESGHHHQRREPAPNPMERGDHD